MKKSFVKVCFNNCYGEYSSKEYEFETYQKLAIGDFVVVDTQNGLQVAKVVQIDTAGEYSNKLVVCKVDLEQHAKLVQKEKAKAELEAKMEARLKESIKLETFKKLAELDPEMKKLVEEFEEFNKEEV